MKLPFIKHARRVDRALDELGFMPQIHVAFPFAIGSLADYDDCPPAPSGPTEMTDVLGAKWHFDLNRALRHRNFSNYLRYVDSAWSLE